MMDEVFEPKRFRGRRIGPLSSKPRLETGATAVLNEARSIVILSICSAAVSISSATLLRHAICPYHIFPSQRTVSSQESISSLRWHIPEPRLSNMMTLRPTDSNKLPPTTQLTGLLHIFSLSTIVFYRSRKTDQYQIVVVLIVVLLGLVADMLLLLRQRSTHWELLMEAISVLPCILSVGGMLSAILHIGLSSQRRSLKEKKTVAIKTERLAFGTQKLTEGVYDSEACIAPAP
ncbi:hypothetical protein GGR57DRAFT_100648 [Xylariaceae sp. FL1272]|nr:hypothetical protein GGR57DRAFT_100648 [Xylariaceae sp. FL1272]